MAEGASWWQTLLVALVSLIGLSELMSFGEPLFFTLVVIGWLLAVFYVVDRVVLPTHHEIAALAGGVMFLGVWLTIDQAMALDFLSKVAFYGISAVFGLLVVYRSVRVTGSAFDQSGISGSIFKYLLAFLAIVLIAVPLLTSSFTLSSDISSPGTGGISDSITSSIVEPLRTYWDAYYNRVLNPHNNPNTARLVCMYRMYSSGGFFGGFEMAECQKEMLGNDTEGESKKITTPLRVEMGELQTIPFEDYVEISTVLSNPMVYDVNGQRIIMPAKNVKLVVKWIDGGTTVSNFTKDVGGLDNGDSHTVSFEDDCNGEACFPIFNKSESIHDGKIEAELDKVAEAPISCDWDSMDIEPFAARSTTAELDFGGSLTSAGEKHFKATTDGFSISSVDVNGDATLYLSTSKTPENANSSSIEIKLQNGLEEKYNSECRDVPKDGNASSCNDNCNSKAEVDDWLVNKISQDEINPERVAYLLKLQDYGVEALSEDLNSTSVDEKVSENLLAPDTDYSIESVVKYDYGAEAAFTDSPRWRSGNLMLEVWKDNPWRELTPKERSRWRNTKCGIVEQYGEEIKMQRTAALTTPIIPVMYTSCTGTPYEGESTGTVDVPITLGAQVNQKGLARDKGFKINNIDTNCVEDADLSSLEGWYSKEPGLDWRISPVEGTMSVELGDVQRKKSVGCSMSMNFTARLKHSTSYEVPRGLGE
ncbi:MAG: DUF3488 domain-containing protein [Candidatus Nanohaloarchaeota archaeon QJJ-9]|nr:DUF3488 domain-containing protein [Candidatus Nanohaloarchaeota archaeon QJJ-9]